jgi:hypothetical protein
MLYISVRKSSAGMTVGTLTVLTEVPNVSSVPHGTILSKSIQIRYSPVILHADAIQSQVLTAL